MPRLLAGRYLLDAPMARGGAGEVWRGSDQLLRRQVAVKVVDLAAALDPAAEARFRREVETSASLAHPNIVTIFDAGAEGRTVFLVMELLSGPTLAQVIERWLPLDAQVVIRYGMEICAGLGAAHARGIVHRDLKPANLMFAEDGSLRIVDFGIARIIEATTTGPDLTATSMVVGTPSYIAPEQAVGGRVDARTDLYALGCVLYALLAGHPPYAGANALETLSQHLHAPVPAITDRRADLPAGLATVITDLLAKDPAARPQSSQEACTLLAASAQVSVPAPTPVDVTAPAPTEVLDVATGVLPGPAEVTSGARSRRPGRTVLLVAGASVAAALAVILALATGNDDRSPPSGSNRPATSTSASTSASPSSTTTTNLTPITTATSTPAPVPVTTVPVGPTSPTPPTTTAPVGPTAPTPHGHGHGHGGPGGHGNKP